MWVRIPLRLPMTVETTDYTPGEKSLSECTPAEILKTIVNIRRHGMLRMHAADRLMSRIHEHVEGRGMALYTYHDDGTDPDDKGLVLSIGEQKQTLKTEDYHYAVLGMDTKHQYHIFEINGPFSLKREEIRRTLD